MSLTRIEYIKKYLEKIKNANKELTKKEHFKDLLHRLYSGEKEIEKIIDAISAGADVYSSQADPSSGILTPGIVFYDSGILTPTVFQ